MKGAKEATCTEDGYTGDKVCKVCGEILERGTVIEKLGHVWGEPEWNWSEDGASCKVTFTCQNNSEHKESPNVTVTSEVKTPATCTESGVTTYMATFEFNGEAYTDTKEIADIPATGHNLTNIPAIAPTCTEAGNIEYWYCDTCDKYFSDETATDEIALADTVLEATGHSYENGKCTACGEIDPDFKAVIIEGANGSWQKGTKDGLSFTSNAAFAHFLKVQVDGKDLDASDYAVKEGSTIVTLKAEYLETLSVGKHTLAIVSDTGTAAAEFTIEAASADDNTTVVPPTGDNSNVDLWIALMLVSVCGISMATVYSRRKKYESLISSNAPFTLGVHCIKIREICHVVADCVSFAPAFAEKANAVSYSLCRSSFPRKASWLCRDPNLSCTTFAATFLQKLPAHPAAAAVSCLWKAGIQLEGA